MRWGRGGRYRFRGFLVGIYYWSVIANSSVFQVGGGIRQSMRICRGGGSRVLLRLRDNYFGHFGLVETESESGGIIIIEQSS